MLFQVKYNEKRVKKVIIILLKVIDYVKVKIVVINLNNYQERYDKEEKGK